MEKKWVNRKYRGKSRKYEFKSEFGQPGHDAHGPYVPDTESGFWFQDMFEATKEF